VPISVVVQRTGTATSKATSKQIGYKQ